MSGIQFHRTQNVKGVMDFYHHEVGMETWLRQPGCLILKHGNFLLGFCQELEQDTSGIITFFYRDKQQVDDMYRRLEHRATSKPTENRKYDIYQFYARDPEDRTVEFQTFLHPLDPYMDGKAALTTRRSIRHFTEQPLTEGILRKLFEVCRYAPTSRNSESYYFIVIREPETLERLAGVRDESSAPIARAGTAVAVCADSSKSQRHVQDGCIAAYHFLLSAWLFGLGTCWIGAMDRDDVKDALGIPREHYVATVTPIGYPAETPTAPDRRPAGEIFRIHR
jgi:nitroreductase